MYSGRISSSHHCKECLEQAEAPLGMDVKVKIHTQCRGCFVRWDQGRSGEVREGSRQGGASQVCITCKDKSVVLSHRAACVKGGAAPNELHHQQLQWCLHTCDWQKELTLLHIFPGNAGVRPAQSLHSTFWKEEHWAELYSQLLICSDSLVSVQAISHFAYVDKYSSIYEGTH